MSCVFCEIIKGNLECEKIYEDEHVLAFKDLKPQAPVHFLVIPKEHIENVFELEQDKVEVVSKIFGAIKKISEELNLKKGIRIINNCGEEAGQTVYHMHFHVLAGKKMGWTPA